VTAPLYTLEEILTATGGRPAGDIPAEITGVSIDSRDIAQGELFVAIKGDRFDGHDFVGAALARGAAAALASEGKASGERLIVVPDALQGLVDLARHARARCGAQIVAVTGSAGKTTTKEMIRTVLGAAGPTHASIQSFNNHWGVPLTIARLPADAWFGIFEIGMNHAGEITPLTKLVRPQVAVITNVAAAHLEFFDSVAGIARAKAEIFAGLEPGGTAILNTDHDQLDVLLDEAARAGVSSIVSYGFAEGADWQLLSAEPTLTGTHVAVRHSGREFEFDIPVEGRHMAANAVAALAVADRFGVPRDVATAAVAAFEAPEGRGAIVRLGNSGKPLLLIDQSYNANSASMAAAMDVFSRALPSGGEKVLVLGDMLELGAEGPRLHAELEPAVMATGATRIFLVGSAISALADALGRDRVTGYAPSVDDIAGDILASLAYGDAVMVKGSKGVRLAGLVKSIREKFA
jgi:UDP-N-acetylmuramoyl-tripeptide--D-alanyl-D-alanine ligase